MDNMANVYHYHYTVPTNQPCFRITNNFLLPKFSNNAAKSFSRNLSILYFAYLVIKNLFLLIAFVDIFLLECLKEEG